MATRLVREGDGAVVAESVELARTFATRFLGLMGRRSLGTGAALWLEPCCDIHMMFMRFPIDAVFVDQDGQVLKVTPGVRPWLGFARCPSARSTIELEAGAAARARVAPGDRLQLVGTEERA